MRVSLRFLLPMLVLLTACGAPDRPVAQNAAAPIATVLPIAATAVLPPVSTAVDTVSTAVPVGKRLRDLWPLPQIDPHPISALVYSITLPSDDGARPSTNTIWSVDVTDPSQRTQIPFHPIDPGVGDRPSGLVAPDGSALAYIVPTTEPWGDVYIVQRDGSGTKRVATHVPKGSACHRSFIWSSDSTRLAIVVTNTPSSVNGLTIYDRRTDATTPSVVLGSAFLVGWKGLDTVLAASIAADGQPHVLEQIDATTRQRQVLVTFSTTSFQCATVAPDQQHALIGIGGRSYLLTLATRTLQAIPRGAASAVWNPDGVTTLEIRADTPNSALVRTLGSDQATTVTLVPTASGTAPPYQLLSASPDGRYLALCERRDIDASQPLGRTLIYDIATDTVRLVQEGVQCARVFGWQ